MNWQEIKSEFEYEGSLLDLYIQQTDSDDWQKALDLIRSSPYRLCYMRDSQEAPLPHEAKSVLAPRQEASPFLRIGVESLTINCHFFIEEQIEFDVYPPEITTEAHFSYLCQFMRLLGQGLNKSVDLTPENTEDQIILKICP
jgi:hypothetical protein